MNLKCYINGVIYENVVMGTPFTEEYNETLDSASVIIDHIAKIENLQIGDDIWLYDSHIVFEGSNTNGFCKHYLLSQYSATRLNPTSNVYKYVLELDSETKGLENIQLPNKSFTLSKEKGYQKTVYQVVKEILELYNPKKFVYDNNQVEERVKYSLDSEVETIFNKVYCPSFQLNNPNLRDVLSTLFIVKDCIPVVKNDVIYAMDITKRHGTFLTNNLVDVSFSQTRENYADTLKRTYSNAISEESTCKRVEYLGFRNSDNTLMTLENMRIETSFPIYKIDKIYMCYYKKVKYYNNGVQGADRMFLCKQDITPLVLLSAQKNLLSQDWIDFNNNEPSGVNVIQELAQYKLCTVDYNIGSNVIEGWGTKYSYPDGWWGSIRNKTYIENMLEIIDKNIPYGINDYGYVAKDLTSEENIVASYSGINALVTPYNDIASKLKSIFFQVEYEAFFNGTVVSNKDTGRDVVSQNDNSQSSLTILEKDGLFQKEKVSRFGNPAVVIQARYTLIDQMQPLGSVFDDDIIIYHREYQIYPNYINVLYYGTKDYVLKNYFTSVFSKIRPFNLLSYEESILRSENRCNQLLLSKTKCYDTGELAFENHYNNVYSKIVSFYEASPNPTTLGDYESNYCINYALITDNRDFYVTDIHTFVSGYSLCFNFAMADNVGMGNYIKEMKHNFTLDPSGDYTGSTQDFWSLVGNVNYGDISFLSFIALHIDKNYYYYESTRPMLDSTTLQNLYTEINRLPKTPLNYEDVKGDGEEDDGMQRFECAKHIYKDNKEKLDMTLQIEPICDKDVFVSEWFMKLSDLYGKNRKYYEDKTVSGLVTSQDGSQIANLYVAGRYNPLEESYKWYYPAIIVRISRNNFNNLAVGNTFGAYFNMTFGGTEPYQVNKWTCQMIDIAEIDVNHIKVNTVNEILTKQLRTGIDNGTLTLNAITSLGNLTFDNTNYLYFSTIDNNLEPITPISFTINEGYYGINTYTAWGLIYQTKVIRSNVSNWNEFEELMLSSAIIKTQSFNKNMYCFANKNELTKEMVYNRLDFMDLQTFLTENTNLRYDGINNSFEVKFDNQERPYIEVKIQSTNRPFKSIVFYYLDNTGKMNFVFGVNLTQTENQNGKAKIYLSLVSTKDIRVFYPDGRLKGKLINYANHDELTFGGLNLEE